MADYSSSIVTSILGTTTFSIPVTAFLKFKGTLTLPTESEGSSAQSQVVTVLSQNGTPVYTSNPGDMGFELSLNCTSGDVFTLVMSSSAPIDQGKNVIKCTLAIG